MSLQHSNEATLERHVLTRAQQSLRPEIFARVNEKLVFRRLSYEHQLEIAEKFLAREIEFLRGRGHNLELDKTVLPTPVGPSSRKLPRGRPGFVRPNSPR